MNRAVRPGLVILAAAGLACGDAAPPPSRTGVRPIGGGYEDGADPAIVGIVDEPTGATCTGSLIAPTLVLTAQHCVAEIMGTGCGDFTFGAPRPAARFFVTTRPLLTVNPADYHRVREIRTPPTGQALCGNDLALLVLAGAVATSEASPIEARLDAPPAAGEEYSAVGYGLTSSVSFDSGGTRRRRDGLRVSCVALECGSSDRAASEWAGERGIFGGDSGGPALDTSGRVIGVLSRGAFDGTGPVYAVLPTYADWISAEVARASGSVDAGTPAPDAAGAPPDAGPEPAGDAAASLPDAEPADGGAVMDAAAAADAGLAADAGGEGREASSECRCVSGGPARATSRGPGPVGHPAAPPGDGSGPGSRRASESLLLLAVLGLRMARARPSAQGPGRR